jgi:hypothetical protein
MNNQKNIIVAFHIGRGGRFHSPGHRTFIGEKRINQFIQNFYLRYEHEESIREKYKNHVDFEFIIEKMHDEDYIELLKYGITPIDLGNIIYVDFNNNSVGLTLAECRSGVGVINEDNEYDTTYTKFIEDCTEDEISLIVSYAIDGYISVELDNWLNNNGYGN